MNSVAALLFLRVIGFLEGLSFLVLLLIAMPLKYMADYPHAVRVIGAAHGALFILYLIAVVWAGRSRSWSLWKFAVAVAASFVPVGTFVLEPEWKREQLAAAGDTGGTTNAA